MASETGRPATTIGTLPPELLSHIFGYLAGPPPSDSRLHDEPKLDMLEAFVAERPLKVISLVSRRWRATVLPQLFRNVKWVFDRWDLLLVEQDPDPISKIETLKFIRDSQLSPYVDTLTMFVNDSMEGMYRLREAGNSEDTSSQHSARAGSNSVRLSLGSAVNAHAGSQHRATTYNEDNTWLWEMIFGLVDPRRLSLVASPQMLASLLSRMLFLGDAWCFKMQFHILSLSRETRTPRTKGSAESRGGEGKLSGSTTEEQCKGSETTPGEPSSCGEGHKPTPNALFSIRPWTSLLLNEGSSLRVYSTYEYFLKRPPSVLGALVGSEETPNDTPLIPSTINSIQYVGIFPLASHFETLVQHLPRVDRLFVQLVPRSDVLSDRKKMRNIDRGDLWLERNSCYQLVMRQLFVPSVLDDPDNTPGNWTYLREFASGDAADKEAWDQAVEFVRLSRTAWTVEREGVFVRRPPGWEQDANDSDSENSVGAAFGSDMLGGEDGFDDDDDDHHTHELFQGNLERLAFNGTEYLPYSALRTYPTVYPGNADWTFVHPGPELMPAGWEPPADSD